MTSDNKEKNPYPSLNNWEAIAQKIEDFFRSSRPDHKDEEAGVPPFAAILERLWQIDIDPESLHDNPQHEQWFQLFWKINASWNIQFAPPKVAGVPDEEAWKKLLLRLETLQEQSFPQFEILKPQVKHRRFRWLITQIRHVFHRLIMPYMQQIVDYQNNLSALQQEYNRVVFQLHHETLINLLTDRQVSFNAETVRLLNQIIQKILFSRQKRFNMMIKDIIKYLPQAIDYNYALLDEKIRHLHREKEELQVLRQTINQTLQVMARPGEQSPSSSVPPTPAPLPHENQAGSVGDGLFMDNLYYQFENTFRGAKELIGKRQAKYLPYFQKQNNVLDIGCGRGEFLSLLKDEGIPACGIDLNHLMVTECQQSGLEAKHGDAIEYLAACPDDSLGGIFCAQLIEHLPNNKVMEFLCLSLQKLKPGAYLVIETPNPHSVLVGASTFHRDPTHVRMYHPDTMKFFMEKIGFEPVLVEMTSFLTGADKMKNLPSSPTLNESDPSLMHGLLFNFAWLSEYLCSPQDYAAIGQKRTQTDHET